MPRAHKYTVNRWSRDERQYFTMHVERMGLEGKPFKVAEQRAREASRTYPRHLITLTRDGVILRHFVNGRKVDAHAIVLDAAKHARHS